MKRARYFSRILPVCLITHMMVAMEHEDERDQSRAPTPVSPVATSMAVLQLEDAGPSSELRNRKKCGSVSPSEIDNPVGDDASFDDEYEMDDTLFQAAQQAAGDLPEQLQQQMQQPQTFRLSSVLTWMPSPTIPRMANVAWLPGQGVADKEKQHESQSSSADAAGAGAADEPTFSPISLASEKKDPPKKGDGKGAISGTTQYLSDRLYGTGKTVLSEMRHNTFTPTELVRLFAAIDEFTQQNRVMETHVNELIELLRYCMTNDIQIQSFHALKAYNYLERMQPIEIDRAAKAMEHYRARINTMRGCQRLLRRTYSFYCYDEEPEDMDQVELTEMILEALRPKLAMPPVPKHKQS